MSYKVFIACCLLASNLFSAEDSTLQTKSSVLQEDLFDTMPAEIILEIISQTGTLEDIDHLVEKLILSNKKFVSFFYNPKILRNLIKKILFNDLLADEAYQIAQHISSKIYAKRDKPFESLTKEQVNLFKYFLNKHQDNSYGLNINIEYDSNIKKLAGFEIMFECFNAINKALDLGLDEQEITKLFFDGELKEDFFKAILNNPEKMRELEVNIANYSIFQEKNQGDINEFTWFLMKKNLNQTNTDLEMELCRYELLILFKRVLILNCPMLVNLIISSGLLPNINTYINELSKDISLDEINTRKLSLLHILYRSGLMINKEIDQYIEKSYIDLLSRNASARYIEFCLNLGADVNEYEEIGFEAYGEEPEVITAKKSSNCILL